MPSGQVQLPHSPRPFTSGVDSETPARHHENSKYTLSPSQRWPIPQSRDCGPLCASGACLASSVASYSPSSGRVVSLLYVTEITF